MSPGEKVISVQMQTMQFTRRKSSDELILARITQKIRNMQDRSGGE